MTMAGRGRAKGEQPMVPGADFRSYYGQPILNPPVWKADIPAYFFFGGAAGASSVLAAGAQTTGRHRLHRSSAITAAVALGAGTVALIHDLGRPSRFHHMLRVFKPSSPMSIGSWVLAAYGPAAGQAALSAVTGKMARTGAAGTAVAGALGPVVSTYTAALLSDTAVPAWHDAFRELPVVFAGSSAAAAGGLGMVFAPLEESGPARRLAVAGAATELAAALAMERRLGEGGEPYREGRAGTLLRVARWCTAMGAVAALVTGKRRKLSALAGLALAVGSALTRFGVVEAGTQSATDPRYVVAPQRARLDRDIS